MIKQPASRIVATPRPPGLPTRDLVLLPLISLLTLVFIAFGAEIGARQFFTEYHEGGCYKRDPILKYRNVPNCVSWRKSAEGPLVEYRYNECGYRSVESCGPTPAGTLRVAMLGDSHTEGSMVPYEQTLTTQAGRLLTKACGRPVEFQNLAANGYTVIEQFFMVDEALALNPDLVMMTLVPGDVIDAVDPQRLNARHDPLAMPRPGAKDKPGAIDGGLTDRVRNWLRASRASLAAQHFLFQDKEVYIRLYLARGEISDYLRPPFTPAWEKRFADLDLLLGEIADKVHAADKQFLLIIIPQRIQAAMLGRNPLPSGVDITAFSRRVAEIGARHGILVKDSIEEFSRIAAPERLYFPVDGHLTAEGHMLVGSLVARRIAAGDIRGFDACRAQP